MTLSIAIFVIQPSMNKPILLPILIRLTTTTPDVPPMVADVATSFPVRQ
jgi:hypothetical protein